MHILKNVSLKPYSTMRLGGTAKYLAIVSSAAKISEFVEWAESGHIPVMMIGEGSNIIWGDKGFPGLVLVNKIHGFDLQPHTDNSAYLTVGSGEEWDTIVERVVKLGYSGIEQLSFIPGTTGATPVQNVGAYGREIANAFISLQAYDTHHKKFVSIPKKECGFGYRTSRFKTKDRGRYLITAITLFLTKTNPKPPFYASLENYFTENKITEFTPQVVREAVIAVRMSKLPDPDVIANNGSFFANPIISTDEFKKLEEKFPEVVHWDLPDNKVKLSAAWLIEGAGFKNYHDEETGMATWERQSLVLINEHAKSTEDLLKFKQKITDKVNLMFSVELEQEPELI